MFMHAMRLTVWVQFAVPTFPFSDGQYSIVVEVQSFVQQLPIPRASVPSVCPEFGHVFFSDLVWNHGVPGNRLVTYIWFWFSLSAATKTKINWVWNVHSIYLRVYVVLTCVQPRDNLVLSLECQYLSACLCVIHTGGCAWAKEEPRKLLNVIFWIYLYSFSRTHAKIIGMSMRQMARLSWAKKTLYGNCSKVLEYQQRITTLLQ